MTEISELPQAPQKGEKLTFKARVLDLTTEQKGHLLPAEVRIDAEQISANRFQEMLERTNGEHSVQEHGFEVARDRKGKIITSQIITGTVVKKTESAEGAKILEGFPNIFFPSFPFGPLVTLRRGLKSIARVHTHPQRSQFAHLPAITFTPEDINNYARSNLNASLMVENGGVHMLIGRRKDQSLETFNAQEIYDKAIDNAAASPGRNTIRQMRKNIADALNSFGIRYYFSPDTAPSADGYLHFQDVKTFDTRVKDEPPQEAAKPK